MITIKSHQHFIDYIEEVITFHLFAISIVLPELKEHNEYSFN